MKAIHLSKKGTLFISMVNKLIVILLNRTIIGGWEIIATTLRTVDIGVMCPKITS